MAMNILEQYTRDLPLPPKQLFQTRVVSLEPDAVALWLRQCMDAMEAAQSLQDWRQALLLWNEVKSHLQTHFEVSELAFQCHTEDTAIEAEHRRLRETVEPVIDRHQAQIRELIFKSPFLSQLQDELGEQYFQILKIQQEAFHKENVELETRLNQVLADYTKLTGSAFLTVEGQRYPLAHYKKFSGSPDAALREAAFSSYSAWFLSHREALENYFDQALVLRNQMGKNLGHANFIPLAYQKLRRTGYGPEEVARLREDIVSAVVPLAREIHRAQAKAQGVSRVAIADLDYFPQWQLGSLRVEISEQPQAALEIFESLSPALGAHFRRALQWNLLDLEARGAKAPGAFCTDFSDYRVPFLFLNSVGEATDVTTLLHEAGHSFQAWESAEIEEVELRWPTLEACEVHSMGMEFLAYPYYEKFFSPEDAARFRKRHFADSILLLPYIAMIDEFQHRVYAGEGMDSAGRGELWKSLEEKYLPEIDFSQAPDWQRYRWVRQLHLFRAPFYYIDYAIAQVGAWQLWSQSLQNPQAALENYLKLCRLGGRYPLKEFFALGGLQIPFSAGVLEPLLQGLLQAEPLF